MDLTSISIIIPVLNEQGVIGPLLRHLEAHFPQAQRIVVDGGSSDATVAEARPGCSALLSSEPGRALQMNAGAALASSSYLFFLHADTWPAIGADQLDEYLNRQPKWGFFNVRLSGDSWMFRVIERAMNLRSAASSVATGDQLLFVSRALFERTGGFADIPLMEDVEYCKRLRREAKPLVVPWPVETSSRRWERGGIVRTILRMWCLRLAYFVGVSPRRLRSYYRVG